MMKPFSIIVAVDQKNGIGKDGTLPWHVPEDLKHFKKITTETNRPGMQNAVIMGRKTWESIPKSFRPLPKRLNLVLTRDDSLTFPDGVIKSAGLNEAIQIIESRYEQEIDQVFVIGGQQIFEAAIPMPECSTIYMTCLDKNFQCDTFFPSLKEQFYLHQFSKPRKSGTVSYQFREYQRSPKKEPFGTSQG